MVGIMRPNTAAFKVQEFVAHGANVNCLHIGRKSCEVLVTGGDDKKVNVWTIGKPNAILSLSGHTSPVECVSFDANEEIVIAGSAGGTLKLWDLDQGKVARTLTGHRSNCISVHWHPYGEFFASGSLDTNLKIWDIRRKGCIQTYKGHMRGINSIMFSPDGRWVVSGGEDGVVKLWDLTAGKLMHDFTMHEGIVTNMDFHPNEFLLATGSTDRTVKLWDLETFECIGSSSPEMSCIRAVTFDSEGSSLMAGAEESLKVMGWEPMRTFDHLDVRWSRLYDMCVKPTSQLMGASLKEALVAVWAVDIQNLQPFAQKGNIQLGQGLPQVNGQGFQGIGDQVNAAVAPTPVQSPQQPAAQPQVQVVPTQTMPSHPQPPREPVQRPVGGEEVGLSASGKHRSAGTEMGTSMADAGDAGAAGAGTDAPPGLPFTAQQLPKARYPPSTADAGTEALQNQSDVATSAPTTAPPATTDPKRETIIPANRKAPVGLDPTAFMPKAPVEVVNDEQTLAALLHQHKVQSSCLQQRLMHVRALLGFWAQGDLKTALHELQHMGDQAATVDFLRSGALTRCNLDLELAGMLVPVLQQILPSQYEEYLVASLESTQIVLRGFAEVIKGTRGAATASTLGTNVAIEERLTKCNICYEGLQSMVPDLKKLAARPQGKVKHLAMEVLASFKEGLDMEVS